MVLKKEYEWEKINNKLYYDLNISPRIIVKILGYLPRGKKKYTKSEVAYAYQRVYSKNPAAYSNMLLKLKL